MGKQKKKVSHLWSPKFWPAWVGVGLMCIISRLPRSIRELIGRGLGYILYWFARSRTHIVKVNIDLCFADYSKAERRAMVKRCCLEHGFGIVDTALSWFGRLNTLPKLRLKNTNIIDEALARGRGVLLIGAHFTSIDICSLLFSQLYPASVVYRPLKNPVMNWCMARAMKRFEKAIHRDDVRALIKTLKSGGIVWYAPDQDYGRRHSVFAPFFGVPAATVTATARIVKLSQCVAITASNYRRGGGRSIELVFGEISRDWPVGDDIADCTEINRAIERGIRVEPAQYMWTHRRFKTRPEGEARPY